MFFLTPTQTVVIGWLNLVPSIALMIVGSCRLWHSHRGTTPLSVALALTALVAFGGLSAISPLLGWHMSPIQPIGTSVAAYFLTVDRRRGGSILGQASHT